MVVTLGGAVIAGALVMVLLLSQAGGSVNPDALPGAPLRQTTTYGLGSDDVTVAAWVGGAAAGLIVLLGVASWVTLRRDPWFDETVDELYGSGWVRVIGIPLTAGALGGVFFVVAEHATATPEHPPDLSDLGELMGGTAFLALFAYLPLMALAWLVRRLRGIPPGPPSNPPAPPA